MSLESLNNQRPAGPTGTTGPARATRALAIAFGIVVVLGKGTHGAPPPPDSLSAPAPQAPQLASDTPVAPTPDAPITAPVPVNGPPVDTVKETAPPQTAKKEKSHWRGSEIAYRNTVTAISLDRGNDLTYDPYYLMSLELAPRYSFDDVWSVSADLEIDREVTKPDDATRAYDTLLGDLALRAAASNFATIPGVDINVSAGLGLTLPTSLASQGDTLMFALSPSLSLTHTFSQVLSGFTIGYSARFTKNFHRYTTSELASPIVPGCVGGVSESCDRLLNTGYRNASYRMSNGLDLSLDFNSWLSLSADFAVIVSWLYRDTPDSRVSDVPVEPTDNRYALEADVGLSAHWWKPLTVVLGASTFNPELAPTGGYYTPVFNRFTTLYLDLRLDVAALVEDLTEEK